MQPAAGTPDRTQDPLAVPVRLAQVDDGGQAELVREFELAAEDVALHVARRVVVVVVEPDLADRARQRVGGQLAHQRLDLGRELLGVVRVHAEDDADLRERLLRAPSPSADVPRRGPSPLRGSPSCEEVRFEGAASAISSRAPVIQSGSSAYVRGASSLGSATVAMKPMPARAALARAAVGSSSMSRCAWVSAMSSPPKSGAATGRPLPSANSGAATSYVAVSASWAPTPPSRPCAGRARRP